MFTSASLTAITALLVGLAAAQPTKAVEKRDGLCGTSSSPVVRGEYTLNNNMYGDEGEGQQCTTFDSVSDQGFAWSTQWSTTSSWIGSSKVYSYANAAFQFPSQPISQIRSIMSTWTWRYEWLGTPLQGPVANVAYDLLISDCNDKTPTFEIMIWLDALGTPKPQPSGSLAVNCSIDGTAWGLYKGGYGDQGQTVFNFVAWTTQETFIEADINAFLYYLTTNNLLTDDQCLYSLEAGTQAFSSEKEATFTVTDFWVDIV